MLRLILPALTLLLSMPAVALPTSPDASFGSGGTVLIENLNYAWPVQTLTFDAQGRALLGVSHGGGQERAAVLRLTDSGAIDASFGVAGYADVGMNTVLPSGLAVQGDGRILFLVKAESRVHLFRFLSDGSVDNSFGQGGRVDLATPSANSVPSSRSAGQVAVIEDGRIAVVFGEFRIVAPGVTADNAVFYLLREDGSLDPGLNPNGASLRSIDDLSRTGLFHFPDNTWVVAYSSRTSPISLIQPFFGHLPSPYGRSWQGNLLGTFSPLGASTAPDGRHYANKDGIRRNDREGRLEAGWPAVPAGAVAPGAALNMVALPDGRWLTMETLFQSNEPRGIRLRRLHSNGAVDTSFPNNPNSTQWHNLVISANTTHRLQTHAVDAQGRIWLAGTLGRSSLDPRGDRYFIHRLQGEAFQAPPVAIWNLVPAPISFPPVADVTPGEWVESEPVGISGLSADVDVAVVVSGGQWRRLRPGAAPTAWRSGAGHVRNGDQIQLRHVAAIETGGMRSTTIEVGGMFAPQSGVYRLGGGRTASFQSTALGLPGAICGGSAFDTNCSGAIPDNGAALESTLHLQGICGYITRVSVSVDISHPRVGDLRIALTDPNGQAWFGGSEGIVGLLARPAAAPGAALGSCQGSNILARFTDQIGLTADEACQGTNTPRLVGNIRSANPLAELIGRRGTGNNGAAESGIWKLTVRDEASGQAGTLNGWSVDVSCSTQPPAIADLEVSATGPAEPSAGGPIQFSWVVQNNGPAPALGALFSATLPSGLSQVVWTCGTSSGGSCSLPPNCNPTCFDSQVNASFGLPAGGSMELLVTGVVQQGGGTLTATGHASTPPTVIGGGQDNQLGNNEASYVASVVRRTQLAISSLGASYDGGELETVLQISNGGPSHAEGVRVEFELPNGHSYISANCITNDAHCGGSVSLNGRRVELNGLMLASGQSMTVRARANPGSNPSAGQVIGRVWSDSGVHPDSVQALSVSQSLPIPPAEDLIFRSRFSQ